MRPFGMKIGPGYGIHPHNVCGICAHHAPTHGQARAQIKVEAMHEIEHEIEVMNDDSFEHDSETCWHCVEERLWNDELREKYVVNS